MPTQSRTGIGVDVHPLVENRSLVLGGVEVPFEKGLKGDSDADVLLHAIIDAMLGAAAMGDIGTHFAPGDPAYSGIASVALVRRTLEIIGSGRWQVVFVDATILAERPILKPLMPQIKQSVANALEIEQDSVNVKATTTDGLGFLGKGEGIAAMAVATIERII